MALVNSKAVIQALKNRVTLLAADKKRLEEKVEELKKLNANLQAQLEAKPKTRPISDQPKLPAEPPRTILAEPEQTEKPKRGRARASI